MLFLHRRWFKLHTTAGTCTEIFLVAQGGFAFLLEDKKKTSWQTMLDMILACNTLLCAWHQAG